MAHSRNNLARHTLAKVRAVRLNEAASKADDPSEGIVPVFGDPKSGKPPKSETVTQLRSKDGDEELTTLFQEWLIAFEKTQSATGDEETVALLALSRIESRIATTPADGLHGLVVKLGLDCFLRTPSEQAESAYADLVRPDRP